MTITIRGTLYVRHDYTCSACGAVQQGSSDTTVTVVGDTEAMLARRLDALVVSPHCMPYGWSAQGFFLCGACTSRAGQEYAALMRAEAAAPSACAPQASEPEYCSGGGTFGGAGASGSWTDSSSGSDSSSSSDGGSSSSSGE
jgi:hypothetical protein